MDQNLIDFLFFSFFRLVIDNTKVLSQYRSREKDLLKKVKISFFRSSDIGPVQLSKTLSNIDQHSSNDPSVSSQLHQTSVEHSLQRARKELAMNVQRAESSLTILSTGRDTLKKVLEQKDNLHGSLVEASKHVKDIENMEWWNHMYVYLAFMVFVIAFFYVFNKRIPIIQLLIWIVSSMISIFILHPYRLIIKSYQLLSNDNTTIIAE